MTRIGIHYVRSRATMKWIARIVPAVAMLAAIPVTLAPPAPAVSVEVEVVSIAIPPDVLGALNILAEGRSEPFEGQIAIGAVVRERMRRRYSSDGTVAGTVFEPFQFSWTNSNDPQRVRVLQWDDEDPAYQKAMAAWLASEHLRPAGNAVLYHTEEAPRKVAPWPPAWATSPKVKRVAQLGAHVFYEVI